MQINLSHICVFALAGSLLSGCLAGGHTRVILPHSKYPVSMSSSLESKEGTRTELENVGRFSYSRTTWGMVWSLVSLTPVTDISNAVNQQIAEPRGDGIVNLSAKVSNCVLNFVPIIAILPFWPGCSHFELRGDIVKHAKN